jgi:MFS transporter, ACS family, pantothenate transporter
MKDDLHFKGKDFNYMTTTYLVVYAVCQIPGTSLLTIYSPTYVFVAANLTWSILVGSPHSNPQMNRTADEY